MAADSGSGRGGGKKTVQNPHDQSRFRVSTEDLDLLIKEQGITPPQEDEAFGRTRRGSFVMASTADDDGMHMVDVLHSRRTREQIKNQSEVEPELAIETARDREARAAAPIDSEHLPRRQLTALQRQQDTYKTPEYPGTSRPHIAQVESYQWSPEKGFSAFDRSEFNSGNFSSRETAWVQNEENWSADYGPMTHNHSEAKYAMNPPRATEEGGSTAAIMTGGHDMCGTCQEGLAKRVAKTGERPIAYTGGTAFHSATEWGKTPTEDDTGSPAGHYKRVDGSSITRSRPEEVLASEQKEDHVNWAKKVRELRSPSTKEHAAPEPKTPHTSVSSGEHPSPSELRSAGPSTGAFGGSGLAPPAATAGGSAPPPSPAAGGGGGGLGSSGRIRAKGPKGGAANRSAAVPTTTAQPRAANGRYAKRPTSTRPSSKSSDSPARNKGARRK